MKKIMFLLGVCTVSLFSFGQFSFGVEAGGRVNSATAKSKYDISFEKDARIAPAAAAIVQYDFPNGIAIRSGIGYAQQGVKLFYQDDEFSSLTSWARLNYLQVPLHVMYQHAGRSLSLFGGLGGYAAYGFSGEIKNKLWFYTEDGGYDVTEKLKAFKSAEEDGGDLEKFDVGVSAIAGIELKNRIYVEAGYQFGLRNNFRDKRDTYRNKGAQLTVGYFFKRSNK